MNSRESLALTRPEMAVPFQTSGLFLRFKGTCGNCATKSFDVQLLLGLRRKFKKTERVQAEPEFIDEDRPQGCVLLASGSPGGNVAPRPFCAGWRAWVGQRAQRHRSGRSSCNYRLCDLYSVSKGVSANPSCERRSALAGLNSLSIPLRGGAAPLLLSKMLSHLPHVVKFSQEEFEIQFRVRLSLNRLSYYSK